jgi:hypothetical protein
MVSQCTFTHREDSALNPSKVAEEGTFEQVMAALTMLFLIPG